MAFSFARPVLAAAVTLMPFSTRADFNINIDSSLEFKMTENLRTRFAKKPKTDAQAKCSCVRGLYEECGQSIDACFQLRPFVEANNSDFVLGEAIKVYPYIPTHYDTKRLDEAKALAACKLDLKVFEICH